MRVVLDTNVVISGFLWSGLPYRILRMAEVGEIAAFSSTPLLAELGDTLKRPKFERVLREHSATVVSLVVMYESLVTIVEPLTSDGPIVARDQSDDAVILTALAAEATVIVSGDKHLLDLDGFQRIRVIAPSDFLRFARL